jgi:inhibitor of KinA sporulation pathway (predicted exonuclease)
VLSEYCTNLTKIEQHTVDVANPLPLVLEEFRVWLKEIVKTKNLILPKTHKSNLDGNCCIVTWTNWDFLIQMRNECNRKQLKKLSAFNQWMDLKEIYMEKCSPKDQYSFGQALARENLEFEGQPHSGIDDARMTARLAYKLHREGSYLRVTKDMNHFSTINRPF